MINKQTKIAVQCRSIVKTYGSGASEVFALRGVDLDLYEGELLMLVGPSGCGKTTFISIVTALLKADSGVCEVLGQDINALTLEQKVLFRRQSIGFVFQAFNLLPALTAQENVAVPLLIQGRNRKAAMHEAKAVLDSVGLGERIGALPSELSGGQQQRVAIARALVHRPKLIVCDEPTSSLDHKSGQMVMQLLRHIADQSNTTLLVVTHDNRIYHFGDRMAHMDDGRIIKTEMIQEKKETSE
ncbi:MAG TPA: ABC transporter ATP-binding protein [Epsilonproteobacteria bacterium]|nr:ABC transporter ATP-binding protein [Campylobacterota bacterium]